MNKKTFAILAFLIVAASITAVSAFELGDLFSSGENKTVTVGGIDFNIPAGFEEESSQKTHKVADAFNKSGYKVDAKAYKKDSTEVGLVVVDYSDYEVDGDEMLARLDGNETTINGEKGIINFDETYLFSYVNNTNLVIISSSDENIIGDFIIA